MSEIFTASTGGTVSRDGENVWIPDGYVSPMDVIALREFFLHERDQELGRWRSKEYPDYFGMADEGNHIGWFYNERTNHGFYADRDANDRLYTAEEREVVAEYFDAHPEPRPWHDAKPGEVWVLDTVTGEHAMQVLPGGDFDNNDYYYEKLDDRIKSGRKIWPEES